MSRRNSAFWTLTIGTLALLLGLSFRPGSLEAQGGSCNGTWVCEDVFNPGAGQYVEVCHCCEGGESPGGTPAVVTVQPPPSPTPPPGGNVNWCLPNECPPGETRLWLVWYLYNLKTYMPVRPVEPCCGDSCPCGEPVDVKQPCGTGSGWLRCSEYEAKVQCALPVWLANREPYPRALVTLPLEVWVSDAAGNPTTRLPVAECWGGPVDPGGGDCDDDEPPPGTMCNYRLGLRVEPGSEPPTWQFEACGSATGWRASCPGWERSSWGKPELGLGMPPDCPKLPAYTIRATVPYWWSFGRQWDAWEKVGEECKPEWVEEPGGGYWKEDCDPIYGWVHHGPNWVLLDLRDYGWPTPYMRNPEVMLVPHPPCDTNPMVGVIYVPCIEVQAPIEKQP
jgi:hypothetical protein